MLEYKTIENIFYLPKDGEAVCVTTNGIIKSNGHAVMGAGIAKEANDIFHLSEKLGFFLKQYGNRAFNLGKYKRNNEDISDIFTVFSFPTKHHYKDKSDINLIIKSCNELVQMCTMFGISKVYLVPPGCGLGGLEWEDVKEKILSILSELDNNINIEIYEPL